jgi:ankyrin repeat protein
MPPQITANMSPDDRENVLSKVLGSSLRKNVANAIPSFLAKLHEHIPERQQGELISELGNFFDPLNKNPLRQLFLITAYFSSNNMLTHHQLSNFVEWTMGENHVESLKRFLQLNIPTTRAFRTRVMEAGADLNDTSFLRSLHAIGAEFDDHVEKLMRIDDPDFQSYVLSAVSRELLKGDSGWRVLRSVAATSSIEVAKLLIKAGANIDNYPSNDYPTTPLWEAINRRNLAMVECLVDAGADIRKWSFYLPRSPLAKAIVEKDKKITEYLISKKANIDVQISQQPAIDWAFEHAPEIYRILALVKGNPPAMTTELIMSNAEISLRMLSDLLARNYGVSKVVLEKALTQSVREKKMNAVVSLLQYGVDPSGPSLPDGVEKPLEVAVNLEIERHAIQYCDLLIQAGVDTDISGILDPSRWNSDIDDYCDISTDVLERLLNSGANLNKHGPRAFLIAMKHDTVAAATIFLNRGLPIETYCNGFTCLQSAARHNRLNMAKYLLQRGANINAKAHVINGQTALQAAAQWGTVDMIRMFLDFGADVNAAPALTGGFTALEASVRVHFFEAEDGYYDEWYSGDPGPKFKILLENGAKVKRPDGKCSFLLHDIIKNKYASSDLLRIALESGTETHHMSPGELLRTPLQVAGETGRLDCVQLLIEHGADFNAAPAPNHGRTALQAAASADEPNMDIVRLLLDRGAEINAAPAVVGGITALQGASIKGHINIVRMLIESGADANADPAVKDGRTAIEGAAEHGRLDTVKMLLNAGAVGDVVGKTGFKEAIRLARKHRHFAVAELLEARAE